MGDESKYNRFICLQKAKRKKTMMISASMLTGFLYVAPTWATRQPFGQTEGVYSYGPEGQYNHTAPGVTPGATGTPDEFGAEPDLRPPGYNPSATWVPPPAQNPNAVSVSPPAQNPNAASVSPPAYNPAYAPQQQPGADINRSVARPLSAALPAPAPGTSAAADLASILGYEDGDLKWPAAGVKSVYHRYNDSHDFMFEWETRGSVGKTQTRKVAVTVPRSGRVLSIDNEEVQFKEIIVKKMDRTRAWYQVPVVLKYADYKLPEYWKNQLRKSGSKGAMIPNAEQTVMYMHRDVAWVFISLLNGAETRHGTVTVTGAWRDCDPKNSPPMSGKR